MFRHPKYYRELRKRALDERNSELHVRPISGSEASDTDRAISQANSTRGLSDVRPGPGPKQQASSAKLKDPQATSDKRQALRCKRQA